MIKNASIEKRIEEANTAYRTGNSIITDEEYDSLVDQLPEGHPLKNKVGFEVSGERKAKLPYPMFSMSKIKTIDELHAWYVSKGILGDVDMIITPKYDGLSFLLSPEGAYTRGDGIEGQRSDSHYKVLTSSKKKVVESVSDVNIIGEVIMRVSDFKSKYAEDYKNPRNLVAGMFNKKDPRSTLKDVQYLCYGTDQDIDKDKQLEWLNKTQDVPVPFKVIESGKITHELLEKLYDEWSQEFEIDGLIIECNDKGWRSSIGKERNHNPAYARAYKGFTSETKDTKIVDIEWNVSKEGKLIPVVVLEPIDLGGVTIQRVTACNAKMVEENSISIGSIVTIKRAGDVIPRIMSVDGNPCV